MSNQGVLRLGVYLIGTTSVTGAPVMSPPRPRCFFRAPRARVTGTCGSLAGVSSFNPRPRAGGDEKRAEAGRAGPGFNPRPPRGGRRT